MPPAWVKSRVRDQKAPALLKSDSPESGYTPFFAKRSAQRTIFVQDHRDFKITRAHNQVDVPSNGLAKFFAWITDGSHLVKHGLLQDIHTVVHNLKQQAILASNMVVKTGLRQTHGLSNILHRGAGVAFFIKHARCLAANLSQPMLSIRAWRHERNVSQRGEKMADSLLNPPARPTCLKVF